MEFRTSSAGSATSELEARIETLETAVDELREQLNSLLAR
jgi:uncharacterized protein YceH (UPF0502 family)